MSSARPPQLLIAILFSLVSILPASEPSMAAKGAWTDPQDWKESVANRHAVHLALLPGDNAPDHSRVVFWGLDGNNDFLERGWSPGNDYCAFAAGVGFTTRGSAAAGYNIFCGGQTVIADKLLVVSGVPPEGIPYGDRRNAVFTAGSSTTGGSWQLTGQLRDGRYYPTAVPLRDGRVLTIAGTRFAHIRVFGGTRDGTLPTSAEGDSVLRFGTQTGGVWDPSILPAASGGERPPIRHRHSAAEMGEVEGFKGHVYFGGLSAISTEDDTWILLRTSVRDDADYGYAWSKVLAIGDLPPALSDHAAIVRGASMIVFGGRRSDGSPYDKVWRLIKSGLAYEWSQVQITAGAISARFGHSAVYDATGGRMLVFGGTTGDTQNPADIKVHELLFNPSNPNQASWVEHTPPALDGTGTPAARYWHSMAMDQKLRLLPGSSPPRYGRTAFLFGGKAAAGLSNELWELWLFTDGTMGWRKRSYAGAPGARARHVGALNAAVAFGSEKLFINGGELSGGGGDAVTYVLEPWAQSPIWQSWASSEAALAGHAGAVEFEAAIDSRITEVYDPATGQWFADTGAHKLWQYYPPSFTVPGRDVEGGRVIGIDHHDTYYLDVKPQGTPSGDWVKLTGGTHHQPHTSGVMYEPGRILIAGGATTGAVGTAQTLDTGNLGNAWQATGSMLSRMFHNLVLLPGGQVLAVGGMNASSVNDLDTTKAQFFPQLWDPATGLWTDTTDPVNRLARQQIMRGYHSTAILLPDGRVLSGGGYDADKVKFEVFCPPYLFTASGGPATRPLITGAPTAMGYGQSGITVCVDNSTPIEKVCLIRPGATTHMFDQNQRYVPLAFSKPGGDRLSLTTPSGADVAPPGYYLLFVIGSSSGPDVPSVARWIKLGSTDPGDSQPPGTIDLQPDVVTATSISLVWNEPGDDGYTSGTIQEHDLRRSSSAINSECAWYTAQQLAGEPPPLGPTTEQFYGSTGLACCTWYEFALRALDDRPQLSALHPQVRVRTLCPMGCGGSAAAQSRIETNGAVGESSPSAVDGAPTVTVIETRRTAEGGWRMVARKLTDPAAFAGLTAVESQIGEGGGWRSRASFQPAAGDRELGLCALRDGGRYVVPANFGIVQLAAGVSVGGVTSVLSERQRSLAEAGGVTPLMPGDSLDANFGPGDTAVDALPSWFVLLRRSSDAPLTLRSAPAGGLDRAAPFILHPNVPNPFATSTAIRFDLEQRGHVVIAIHDLLGRRVRVLASGWFDAGTHTLSWDRRDEGGSHVRPGVYACRMRGGSFKAERKLVLTR